MPDFREELASVAWLGAIEVSVPTDVNIDEIARGLAASQTQPARCLRFSGDYLRPADGQLITDALGRGDVVVVGVSQMTQRWAHVLDAWARYRDSPRHASVQVDRQITFTPLAGDGSPGTLIIVGPHGDGLSGHRGITLPIDRAELAAMLNAAVHSPIVIERIGYASLARDLTIRDVCLLHLRDPAGTPRRSVGEALNDDDQFTWTDLQQLLHQPRTAYDFLPRLARANRLNPVLADTAEGLLDIVQDREEEHRSRTGIHVWPSIYDAVWHLHFLDGEHVFRGQGDARWPLTPTLLRPRSNGEPVDIETLVGRVELTRGFVDVLRERQARYFPSPPTEDEIIAVAQHYGFATPLLDYTRSLAVAALFATMEVGDSAKSSDHVGVIHYMDADRAEVGQDRHPGEDLPGFSLQRQAGIRIGDINVIVPSLSEIDDRITRQAGVFLAGFDLRGLTSISIDRIYFRQLAGNVFEDPSVKATRSWILPPNSALADLADAVRDGLRAARPAPLPALLANFPIPNPGLTGAVGAHMFRQVRQANSYFAALREILGDGSREQVAEIFNEYFDLCRVRADTGEVLSVSGSPGELTPLEAALDRIAALCAVDSDTLEQNITTQLGILDDTRKRPRPANASSREQQLAFALGMYLASWEKLQHLRGLEASDLVSQAELTLKMITIGFIPPVAP